MEKCKEKIIVFDMGGVLIDLNIEKVLKKYFREEYCEKIASEVFYGKEWRDMDAGIRRSDDVIPEILPKFPEEIRPLLGEMISNFYPYMPPIPETEELVVRLKKAGYKIYLLSNASARFFDEYQNIPALRHFDGFFISALYHILKPNKEIYEAFCNKFSLNPENCFFIDDMRANIEGAREYGMQGFVFDTRDYASLEKELNAFGVYF